MNDGVEYFQHQQIPITPNLQTLIEHAAQVRIYGFLYNEIGQTCLFTTPMNLFSPNKTIFFPLKCLDLFVFDIGWNLIHV